MRLSKWNVEKKCASIDKWGNLMESILSYATRDIKSMDGNIDEYKISGD